MRIGIDCRTILNPEAGNRAGVAQYTYQLVKTLLKIDKLDEFVLFFDHRARGVVKEFLEPNTKIRFFTFSEYKKYLPFFYSHVLTASNIGHEKLDVYHSPANIIPFRYNGKFCVTVHDLAIYRRPDLFPSGQGFSVKYLVPRSINNAAKIIAVSESTKKDVEIFFKVDPKKIKVIYEGVDHDRFVPGDKTEKLPEDLKRKYKISQQYILFVGTLEPRKNLIRLLEAYYQLTQKSLEFKDHYQLVLVGSKGWLYDEIFEEVENRNLQNNVVFPGYLVASDLPKLYAHATAFVYPSLYEGFGLPVLEAMASGTPVITSSVSSMPEIAKDAGLLVDPLDVEGLANAMEKIITDKSLQAELSEKGKKRSEKFSWEKCARETLEIYREVGKKA
ncbi:MAG: glycosyltransferase family 1 protein [Candidatus Doudnabacteria bacterium CG10_big_fil_rev_8_21_14_0_10_41_10]|uniref:Glycosyltransferase family 1 protein n=1 Tax=Candidatus Doudnabacteria bacterium CG10_big_fil_rev_8_21_14_0_10_41_10 TaxID=1974551 RepID=A0A2H0VEZ6_9BACT|nr:MAG: glycosyltransferase family 1 protein [Candidatus Doudnabacteria bacterium CG10_big_fil_rev_8_21_14_0_10_41_10]